MKRNEFLSTSLLGASGMLFGPAAFANTNFTDPEPIKKEIVNEFVGASHGRFEKVKELIEEYPNLLFSSWDWGNGDFESGIEAAGHVGNTEIADFLIGKGARITLPVLTMLGRDDLVLPVLEAYPTMIHSLGAHGFTLLHHAKVGGEAASKIKDYLTDKGLTEFKVAIK